MASFHFSIKSGKRGKAREHSAYIAREGKHATNSKRDLVAIGHGNLPEWANNRLATFWRIADEAERCNGAAYREFEVALPVELTPDQNRELVETLIEHEIGNKTYQYAIHSPKAALGSGNQPHAHIMFSDRVPDNIERAPAQHFRRFNSRHPENGGCRKDSGGKERSALRNYVVSVRENCAALLNNSLEKYGHTARVDHRSNMDRGLTRQPERHLGHVRVKLMTQDELTEIQAQRQMNEPTSSVE
jgi:hypothetical protein